jgi:regulator of sigma D
MAITAEKREYTRDQVLKLLDERQEMLVLFCELAGLDPYQSERPIDVTLRAFCQKMVDYIAAGHFAIYDRLSNGGERRVKVLDVAALVYRKLEDTTDIALAFNDKYDEHDHLVDYSNLANDLAMLGEALSNRADYEDRLIDALIY